MSDRFGIIAGSTFKSADADTQKSWTALSCTTKPAGNQSEQRVRRREQVGREEDDDEEEAPDEP